MIKIFHPLLCYYPSQAGGPANTLFWLNTELNKHNILTNVLSTTFGLDEASVLDDENVKFLDKKGFFFVYYSIKKIIDADIVQFSSLFFRPTFLLIMISLIFRKTIIISPRGELYESALSKSKYVKNIFIFFVRIFQKRLNFHASNSVENDLILEHFPLVKSVKIIPNFIRKETVYSTDLKSEFVFLGRINSIKNIDILIKAFAKVLKTQSSDLLKLKIIGVPRIASEKSYLEYLIKLVSELNIKDNIQFLGQKNGKDKNIHLAESIALILPSKSENFGNVVLEALIQGTPVIASKGTPWQELEKNEIGYWVEPVENEIAEAITSILLLEENKYNKIRIKCKEYCDQHYIVQNNINQWIGYYNKLLNQL